MSKLILMYFSPTNTTKKIVSAVGKIFFERLLSETAIIDLTRISARLKEYVFTEEDILVFGAPVYGGRLPQLLVPVIDNCKGNGARAVILSVYGNRDYDDALAETADLFSERGFKICAAGAFIGEHSYSRKVGANRPDLEDILAAQTFAVMAYEKVIRGTLIHKTLKGKRPYKQLSMFMEKPKQTPKILSDRCTHCGKCVSVCPVCNIAADLTTFDRCIGCGACVKFCPFGAREFMDENIIAAREKLEQNCLERKNPEFFI